jgi:hypothetical protein
MQIKGNLSKNELMNGAIIAAENTLDRVVDYYPVETFPIV